MKNKLVILLFTLLITTIIKAQSYEFLNQIITNKPNDTIYVKDKFNPLSDEIINSYLTESFIKLNWAPSFAKNSPKISLFLENFNLKHVRKTAISNNNSSNDIDFNKLNPNIIKVTDVKIHLKNNKDYLVFTKPIFNCSQDWAISYIYAVFHKDIGNSGEFMIYRKVDGNWIYYHKILLWIS